MGALGPRLRTTVIMPLTADQRHALLLADSSRDVGQITVVIEHVFAANSDANLFDIELAFRDAACAAYVIAGPSKALHVVTGGLSAMLAALTAAGRSIDRAEPDRAGGKICTT
jgi:hypothetical protein